jgi:hypothetical protein
MLSFSSCIRDRVLTPADATFELRRLEACLAQQGFSIHLYACSDLNPVDQRRFCRFGGLCHLNSGTDSASCDPLLLDEFTGALAASTFKALVLAVNSEGIPVRGWLSMNFNPFGTAVQHLFLEEESRWMYLEEGVLYECELQHAMLDILHLLLWRAYLQDVLAESQAFVFLPDHCKAPSHLADAPLMLSPSKAF